MAAVVVTEGHEKRHWVRVCEARDAEHLLRRPCCCCTGVGTEGRAAVGEQHGDDARVARVEAPRQERRLLCAVDDHKARGAPPLGRAVLLLCCHCHCCCHCCVAALVTSGCLSHCPRLWQWWRQHGCSLLGLLCLLLLEHGGGEGTRVLGAPRLLAARRGHGCGPGAPAPHALCRQRRCWRRLLHWWGHAARAGWPLGRQHDDHRPLVQPRGGLGGRGGGGRGTQHRAAAALERGEEAPRGLLGSTVARRGRGPRKVGRHRAPATPCWRCRERRQTPAAAAAGRRHRGEWGDGLHSHAR